MMSYQNINKKGKSGRGVLNGVYNNSGRNTTTNESITFGQNQRFGRETLAPWRHIDWSRKSLDDLKGEVMRYAPKEDKDVTKTRILMIGPVGAGKSSFYNTIDSIYRGRITQHASSGSANKSLTTHYTTYNIKDRETEMNFRLCDTRGMEELNGLHNDDLKYLLDGNIKSHYKFSPKSGIGPWDQCFLSYPSADDRVHCIVFVIDATSLDALSPELVENVKKMQDLAKKRDISQTVILTKVDKLCKETKKDISFAYTCPDVEKCVEKAADLVGLPRSNVFAIKNYENETELDDNMNILALVALRQTLNFSEDASKARLKKARIEAERAEWKIAKLTKSIYNSSCSIL